MPPPVDRVLQTLEANEPAAIDRLMDWLRIPSISTDPAFAGQLSALTAALESFESRIITQEVPKEALADYLLALTWRGFDGLPRHPTPFRPGARASA